MLTATAGLSESDLSEIADLERRAVDHDGGRLKLEWSSLRGRSGEQIDDLLWRDGDRLVGFLGFYSFGSPDLELAGMVDPAVRRRGIGTALLAAALPIAHERGFTRALLVTPRSTPTGAAFAHANHATLEHSEHFLALDATPTSGPLDPGLVLRLATEADAAEVARILADGFGQPARNFAISNTPAESTMAIERAGRIVGTVRLSRRGDTAGIYGLAVDPPYQGQGIGRDVLNRVCRDLRADGAAQVTLEVATDNDRALDLYLSVGFERRATEDYFELPTPATM